MSSPFEHTRSKERYNETPESVEKAARECLEKGVAISQQARKTGLNPGNIFYAKKAIEEGRPVCRNGSPPFLEKPQEEELADWILSFGSAHRPTISAIQAQVSSLLH